MNVGCNLAGINVNLLAYADDLVLLAPSWSALQSLLQAAEAAATKLGGAGGTCPRQLYGAGAYAF